MPLKRLKNGQYVIKTEADAKQAVETAQEVKAEPEIIEAQEMMQDATEMMRGAARYLREKNKKALALDDGQTFKLITQHTRIWVATEDDMPDDPPKGCMPLQDLVDKKTFMKLTRRVADPEKIQTAIGLGLIEEEAIEAAFIEIPKSSYLRKD